MRNLSFLSKLFVKFDVAGFEGCAQIHTHMISD